MTTPGGPKKNAAPQMKNLKYAVARTALRLLQGVHSWRVPTELSREGARRKEGGSRGGEAGGTSAPQWHALPTAAGL